jgi:hypothetical protein
VLRITRQSSDPAIDKTGNHPATVGAIKRADGIAVFDDRHGRSSFAAGRFGQISFSGKQPFRENPAHQGTFAWSL